MVVSIFQSDAVNLNKRQPPKPINRRSVSRVFERVGQKVAPEVALGTHSMRKTRGYAMHKAGRSIESIAKVLNHSSPAVTLRLACHTEVLPWRLVLSLNSLQRSNGNVGRRKTREAAVIPRLRTLKFLIFGPIMPMVIVQLRTTLMQLFLDRKN